MEEILFDEHFYRKLNTLMLSANMRLNQGLTGLRKASTKGASVEFSDFREYILGDDIRRIDWNAFGRTDKLYIKQYMEEKEAYYHIFLDGSGSMAFGSPRKSKAALELVAALSYIILNQMDRVRLCQILKDQVVEGNGRNGRASFAGLMEELRRMEFVGESQMERAVKRKRLPGRGYSILISDLLDESAQKAVEYLLYQKQEVILIQMLSPEEREVLEEGNLDLLDKETGKRMRVTMNRQAIKRYQERLAEQEKKWQQFSRKYGILYQRVYSDQPLETLIFQMFTGQFLVGKGGS